MPLSGMEDFLLSLCIEVQGPLLTPNILYAIPGDPRISPSAPLISSPHPVYIGSYHPPEWPLPVFRARAGSLAFHRKGDAFARTQTR